CPTLSCSLSASPARWQRGRLPVAETRAPSAFRARCSAPAFRVLRRPALRCPLLPLFQLFLRLLGPDRLLVFLVGGGRHAVLRLEAAHGVSGQRVADLGFYRRELFHLVGGN